MRDQGSRILDCKETLPRRLMLLLCCYLGSREYMYSYMYYYIHARILHRIQVIIFHHLLYRRATCRWISPKQIRVHQREEERIVALVSVRVIGVVDPSVVVDEQPDDLVVLSETDFCRSKPSITVASFNFFDQYK